MGENVTLVATAIGVPEPAYQGRREGNNVSEATNGSYSITDVQLTHGTNYSVVASNISGMATSSTAGLIVHGGAVELMGAADQRVSAAHLRRDESELLRPDFDEPEQRDKLAVHSHQFCVVLVHKLSNDGRFTQILPGDHQLMINA